MGLVQIALMLLVSCSSHKFVESNSYHLGECPVVETTPDFSMEKLSGRWYAIEKTSTPWRCLEYNFEKTDRPNIYKLDQMSEYSVMGINEAYYYHFVGSIVTDPNSPSRMVVNYPLSVSANASFDVFAIDSKNYAGIYTCQHLPVGYRHSVTILSRSKTLDKKYLDMMHKRIASSNLDPLDTTIVNQINCLNLKTTTLRPSPTQQPEKKDDKPKRKNESKIFSEDDSYWV